MEELVIREPLRSATLATPASASADLALGASGRRAHRYGVEINAYAAIVYVKVVHAPASGSGGNATVLSTDCHITIPAGTTVFRKLGMTCDIILTSAGSVSILEYGS